MINGIQPQVDSILLANWLIINKKLRKSKVTFSEELPNKLNLPDITFNLNPHLTLGSN
jgi:hypothetical protein